jgi:SAM-dependent methyltransferase
MRVLGAHRLDVDEASVIDFFDRRARTACDASAVRVTMLQDARSDLAERRNRVEVAALQTLLATTATPRPRTLDVGCGSGRLHFALPERLGAYFGVDGAPALVDAARQRAAGADNARFEVQDLARPGLAARAAAQGPFDLVLCSGILIYLNEASVKRLLDDVVALAAPRATWVLREPVGIESRLTLVDHWSQELGAAYNAIYRTAAELEALVREAAGARLASWHSSWLYDDAELNNRRETRQAWMVATLT